MAEQEEPILCARDGVPLVAGKVEMTYQGHFFPVDLLRCPVCGEVFIPEELAVGRILEVEQTLEEK
jgi:hypothetical protein